MFLQMAQWEKIRCHFSQEEKEKLNAAIDGPVLCPKGCILDESKLGEELVGKLKVAMKEALR
jgi:hypothetical protein